MQNKNNFSSIRKYLFLVCGILYLLSFIIQIGFLHEAMSLSSYQMPSLIALANDGTYYANYMFGFIVFPFLITGLVINFSSNRLLSQIGGCIITGVGLMVMCRSFIVIDRLIQYKNYDIVFATNIIDWLSTLLLVVALIIALTEKVIFKDKSKDDNIDNVIKWKSLLDQGIITKEEFDLKRKEILGLNDIIE